MTEAEWRVCGNSQEMYPLVAHRMTPRQRRLFALACGRRHCRIWEHARYADAQAAAYWLPRKPQIDALCARAIDAAEEQLDGRDREEEIRSLRDAVFQLGPLGLSWDLTAAVTGDVTYWVSGRLGKLPTSARGQAVLDATRLREMHQESLFQAHLLRDIVGNPFGPPPTPDPAWLRWQGGRIVRLARTVYDGCRFGDLPLLADMLADAGCADEQLLGHCRSGGEHTRGCWALDLLLGRS